MKYLILLSFIFIGGCKVSGQCYNDSIGYAWNYDPDTSISKWTLCCYVNTPTNYMMGEMDVTPLKIKQIKSPINKRKRK
jgi:hypothetical protein